MATRPSRRRRRRFVSNFAFWQEASYFDVAGDRNRCCTCGRSASKSSSIWSGRSLLSPRRAGGADRWSRRCDRDRVVPAHVWTVRIDRVAGVLRAVEPLLGVAGGRAVACDRSRRRPSGAWKRAPVVAPVVAEFAASVGLIAIAAGVCLIDSPRVFPGLWVLLPVGGTVFADHRGPRRWLNRALLSQPSSS